jgi:hypothetical protein
VGDKNDRYEQEAERGAAQFMSGVPMQVSSMVSPALVQRTKVCSKRLEAPVLGWFFNHHILVILGWTTAWAIPDWAITLFRPW